MSRYLQNGTKSLSEALSRRGARIHFLGILGVSMSSLAEYLLGLGYTVTGSDVRADRSCRLAKLGVEMTDGRDCSLVRSAELVVVSHAIPADAPELVCAASLGIPVCTRAELLGEVMLGWRHRVGVSGTHGKSTTTAMLHRILTECHLSPTTFSGAPLEGESSFSLGDGDIFLYEACEYKNSFHSFSPTVAIINAVELDHTDFFANDGELLNSFFISTRGAECVIINTDYPLCAGLYDLLRDRRVVTYGKDPRRNYVYSIRRAERGVGFLLCCHGESREVSLGIEGEYNAANATAALAAAEVLGIPLDDAISALRGFKGVSGRCEVIGRLGEIEVILDYAHHPTELSLSIGSLVSRYVSPTVVFRPHTYTRTRDLWQGFVEALSLVDRPIITDVYAAREAPIEGFDAARLASAIPNAIYVPYPELAEFLLGNTVSSPLVLMGAGDFTEVINKLEIRKKK